MAAGHPIHRREKGFANDIHGLNTLRSALKLNRKHEKNLVAQAIASIDSLIDTLAKLHENLEALRTE